MNRQDNVLLNEPALRREAYEHSLAAVDDDIAAAQARFARQRSAHVDDFRGFDLSAFAREHPFTDEDQRRWRHQVQSDGTAAVWREQVLASWRGSI